MKPVLAGLFLAAFGLPALAADYSGQIGSGSNVGYVAGYGVDDTMQNATGTELRRYYIDTGRAYGAPVSYYARVTPAPPDRFIYANGVRGRARVEIDERPSFPGPDWIKLIE